MIDLHSHLLPGVDDGAADLDEALALLRLAAADGVQTQVLTPHIQPGKFDNDCTTLRARFETFRAAVREQGIDIGLQLSAEIRIGPEIQKLISQDNMLWLGAWDGFKLLLLEFPHSNVPLGSINIVRWLKQRGVRCMIAHPERNREFQLAPHKLKAFLDEGCLVQITASSLTGHFGQPAYQMAADLLKQDAVTVIASDAHNMNYRPPRLSAGVEEAGRIVGIEQAMRLATDAPARVLGLMH